MKNRNAIILISIIAILLIGTFVRLWNLTGHDMRNDDTLYSFRALGYFDYVGSENKQSTPVTWFAESQWWQQLSFHDAPPLVFAVQWLFFKMGGDSLLAARLPFAIAGILSVFAIFLLGRLLVNTGVGIVAAAALAVMNYHVWISRIGLLESFVILWSILAIYFFVRAEKDYKNYLWWGICCAAGLLTKYTFLFIVPVFAIPLLLWRRSAWMQKWFYVGIAAFFILFSPVIIYNVMVWETRGHFDAALSTMVGMQPEDYKGLIRQVAGGELSLLSLPRTITTIVKVVANNISGGFQAILLLSLTILAYLTVKDWRLQERKRKYDLVWLGFIGALLILTLASSGDKFTTIVIPFLSLTMGIAMVWLWQKLKGWQRAALVVLAIPLVAWELFFTAQSQWLPEPLINDKRLLSNTRPTWEGYNELESYVKDFYDQFPDPSYVVFTKTPQIFNYQAEYIQSLFDQGIERPQQKHLLVYDDRMSWFHSMWIFERRRLYDVATIPSLTQFLNAVNKNGAEHFNQYGFADVTIIMANGRLVTDIDNERLQNFANKLTLMQKPIFEIINPRGEIAFKVFRLPLDPSLSILFE